VPLEDPGTWPPLSQQDLEFVPRLLAYKKEGPEGPP